MFRNSLVSKAAQYFMLLAVLALLSQTYAQYYGVGNPYAQRAPEPRRQMPNTARNVGGFSGNPYRNSTVPPTGMPIGTSHNFFGGGTTRSVAHKPAQKPFSNVHIPGPLMTSRQAAQIEVARGLWGWGP